MKLKKGDLIIIIILVIAVAAWLGVKQLGETEAETEIVIETNGSVYKVVPLTEKTEPQDIHIELENGNYIDIAIDEKGAYVKDVICPDKICQKTGLVSKVGQSIVCLPNKVIVYIEGAQEAEVDDVSF